MLRYFFVLICAAALAAPVWSACDAGDKQALQWLDRMSHSLREISYQGVFTYQHGSSVQAMHINHAVTGNLETEMVTRLSGDGSQVVRTEHPLDCIHPGSKLVRIAQLYTDNDTGEHCGIARFYRLKMGALQRVAGRSAMVLHVQPRDMYRYGYQMAIDTQTGLLLKTQTLAHDGQVLERFQFADIRIGEFDSDGTEVHIVHEATHPHPRPAAVTPSLLDDQNAWGVHWVPGGFELTEGPPESIDDKTFTDGLAVFSVYVEDIAQLSEPGEGRARQGGTTAYTRGLLLAGRPALITVLGEVPISTARMVADSVQRSDANVD